MDLFSIVYTLAMKELKRTAYHNMKAGVIASRDQLCVHPHLKYESNTNKIHKCRAKVKSSGCTYHQLVNSSMKKPEFCDNSVLDVEELGQIGHKLHCCPYYASKEIAKEAEIIFLPYNYLLDPRIRKVSNLNLKNAIIILDEAHNVGKVCEQSASTLITSTQLRVAIQDMNYVIKHKP